MIIKNLPDIIGLPIFIVISLLILYVCYIGGKKINKENNGIKVLIYALGTFIILLLSDLFTIRDSVFITIGITALYLFYYYISQSKSH